jgi:hypothetical protein
MSEFAEGTGTEEKSFWNNLPDVKGYLNQNLPTMDRSLDTYFDRNFEAIIEEWGLLTENDLFDLERRLTNVTSEINRLYHEKEIISERVTRLDGLISRLEGM